MLGLMQQQPLLISSLLDPCGAASRRRRGRLGNRPGGHAPRAPGAETERRARRLVRALQGLGVRPQDRVGTLAWNGYRHLEIYYAVVRHAGGLPHDQSAALAPTRSPTSSTTPRTACCSSIPPSCRWSAGIAARIKDQRARRGGDDRRGRHAGAAAAGRHALLCYEELMDAADDDFAWPELRREHRLALCYTSGTTGQPEGRAVQPPLHGAARLRDRAAGRARPARRATASCRSCRCSTSTPGACPMPRAWSAPSWCFPGRHLDGASLHELFEPGGVTLSRRRADRLAGPAAPPASQRREASAR